MTVGLLSFSTQAFPFNAGKSQTNLNFLQGGGEFPFLNFMKIAQSWQWNDGSTTRPFTPDLFDSDFYPTTIVQGGVKVGGITIPSQTEYAGNWVVSWSGNGTLTLGAGTPVTNAVTAAISAGGTSYKLTIGTHTFIVNQEVALSTFASPWTSLNGNSYLITAVDATSITIATGLSLGAYVSGGTAANTLTTSLAGSGSTGRCVFAPTNVTQSVGITAIGSPRVTNLKLYNINDEATLNAGGVFGAKFKQRLQQAKFGAIRFLNWQNGNAGCATTWDTGNRPLTYYQYQSGQTRSDFYCGTTTNSGADYSVAAPTNWTTSGGGTLPADKSTVHVVWGATSPTTSAVTNTGNNVNWTAHGLQAGNQVIFTDSTGTNTGITVSQNAWPFTNLYYVHTVVSANQFTVSLTNGGSDVTITALNCTCRSMPTLNIGSTSAVTVLGPTCSPPSVSGGNYFVGGSQNSLTTLIYDAAIGAWINQGLISAPGLLQNGVPVSLMIQLCKEVGAHPWFISPPYACTPMTDYHTQLATLCKTTGQSWMVPRFEPPNELWNTAGGFNQTKYAQAVATAYGWGLDSDNWYGRAASTIGQAINAVYGGTPSSQTKYQMMIGFQTVTCGTPASVPVARIQSTKYVLQSPQSGYTASAASGWATHVTCNNYIIPSWWGRNQENVTAFAYYVTNSGNPTAQAANAAAYEATINDGFACTFTNGSPGTVNAVGNGLAAGQIVSFVTNGTFPTGLTISNYWVNTVIDADHFTLSSTDPNNGGATPVNISGSATGTTYCIPNGVQTILAMYTYAQNIAALGAANGVNKISWYEGCYSPDYSSNNVACSITAGTNTTNCVFTSPWTNVQSIRNPTQQQNATNSGLAVGMYIKLSGLPATNGWSAFNGQTVQITAVSGTSITTNLDASAATGALSAASATGTLYTDAGAATSMATALNALRAAGKNAPNLQTHTTTMYNDLTSISGASFPSNYIIGGANNDWSVLDPNIFVTPDPPQWSAIVAFNA
ncbi:hypothetical protein [Bradyrhizobium lablabi]|uniref:Uncharacterized protein n=1 Tax=Bradyrhizobium lablabi TaxID=722472 RepID=A0A1H5JM76_9BRAD|nr:hypothetical protein [Bradyrhizobium lablabi]SEE51567.1 hypothetical protein SAMN05444171_7813 [Bradyrhizobium lablabi]SEE53091.1 hypothetical protein SAMN05444171_7880 [Bradyrhizobium lablabi]